MTALHQKEIRLLLRSLEVQGAATSKSKKGYLVKFPNGSTTSVHLTNSDHRSTMNIRAVIKRAGLQWPFDHQRIESKMGLRLTPEQRELLANAIEAVGDGPTSANAIAATATVSGPTAMSALTRAGFVQEHRGQWIKAAVELEPEDYPTIAYAKTLVVQPPAPVAQERAFLDDADSWTMPVPKKLQAMADLMGLNIEVRIWRTKA